MTNTDNNSAGSNNAYDNNAQAPQAKLEWSTDQYSPQHKIEAWYQMLCESHLPWSIDKTPNKTFNANMHLHSFNGYRLIKCICDPLSGFRDMQQFAQSDDAYLNILYLRSGREHLRIDYRDIHLQAGDIVLWDSTRKMSFTVSERLEKLTLMIPETSLTSVFPNAHEYSGIPISGKFGMGAMFANHLNALEHGMADIGVESVTALMKPTMEMLATMMETHTTVSPSTMKYILLNRVKHFIISHLGEENLTPSTIAEAHNISPRYLHVLFEEVGTSVSTWIKLRRLERCKDEIFSASLSKRPLSDIAYKWGFNHPSHFSKVFKKEYGLSPRAFLEQVKLNKSTSKSLPN